MKWTWKEFKALLKKFVRWALRTYKREIKKFVNEKVDLAVADLKKHISTEVSKKIKNELLLAIIDEKIDIYTSSGANTVKTMVDEYIAKLSAGE